jgi:hypothetical protein
VYGRARPAAERATAAPLSSRPCVWWSYDIAHKYQASRGRTQWRSVESAGSVEPFVLADADAECLVGPVNAEITPTIRDVWYGDLPRPIGPPLPARGFLESDIYRYTERRLSVGDQLSVTGELRSESEIGSDNAAAELLRQWKQDQSTLLARFDHDHDGRIDAVEWEAARQAAAAEAQARALRGPMVRTSVIGEPSHGEPFLIAAMDAAHLVRREKLHAALYFGLGLVCVVLCAWAIEHAQEPAAPLRTSAIPESIVAAA